MLDCIENGSSIQSNNDVGHGNDATRAISAMALLLMAASLTNDNYPDVEVGNDIGLVREKNDRDNSFNDS